ncbi:MAG: hypothetical protein ABSG89_11140 [Bacteroidales bacterium]
MKFYGNVSGNTEANIGYSVTIGSDCYYICGQVTDTIQKPGIIKTNFGGNTIWEKTFGGSRKGYLSKIISLGDGSVISTGQVTDGTSGNTDILVVKINADGSGAVQNTFSGSGNMTGTDILQTSEGFLILGTTDAESIPPPTDSTGNPAGKKDILILRIDGNLNEIVQPVQTGFPGNDAGAAIKPDVGGGYIIAGTTDRYSASDKNDIILVKVNSDFSITDPAIIKDAEDDYVSDIEVVDDGYMIAGTIGSSGVTQSVFVTKMPFNIQLAPVFKQKISNAPASWSVNAMCKYKTSSFLLAGQENTSSQNQMLIFVIDAGGNLIGSQEKIEGSSGTQVAYDVVSDSDNNIIVVGANIYQSNSLITLLKFRF